MEVRRGTTFIQNGREYKVEAVGTEYARVATRVGPRRLVRSVKKISEIEALLKPFRVNLGVGNNIYFDSVEQARPYLQDVFEKTGVVLSIVRVEGR